MARGLENVGRIMKRKNIQSLVADMQRHLHMVGAIVSTDEWHTDEIRKKALLIRLESIQGMVKEIIDAVKDTNI